MLIHERRVDTMRQFVQDATERGAKVLLGGSGEQGAGFYYSPTVLIDVPQDALIMNEEPFGPIAPLVPFTDHAEVFREANRLPYGLSSYVFTNNLQTSHLASTEIEAGMVNINHFGSALPETPFGGIKDSGMGSEGGTETFDGYLVTKFVTQV